MMDEALSSALRESVVYLAGVLYYVFAFVNTVNTVKSALDWSSRVRPARLSTTEPFYPVPFLNPLCHDRQIRRETPRG